jgi:hypothetical protein
MEEKMTIIVFGKELPLNEFAEHVSHDVVMALVKSLKAPALKGTEAIRIDITK